ncbi:MAG TPA: DivIVA domain-containing protein [Gemmatimonadaceae bacterium]|nr:DivIVA domain-containing protein [Gemmatimonadaceae bacterium]
MVDESFHLTPLDVKRYDFGNALRGYDKARVEQFREQVAEELERLTRLAQDLESKAKGFHEQLRAFRERDKALNDALVSAQQLRSDIRDQADRESNLIVREAHVEAERIIEEARVEVRRLTAEVDALERTRRSFVAQLRALAQRQLTEIDAADQAGSAYVASLAGSATVAPVTPATSMQAIPDDPDAPHEEPALPPDQRRSERNTRTPTWLDSSVPE